jgi:hypothetical protein
VLVGQPLDQPFAPLHERDRLLQRRVEVERVDLAERIPYAAQPVGVDVHQRHPTALVHPGDHERGRRHLAADAETRADALRERGLAGPERTHQQHEVAGAQHGSERPAERSRVVNRGKDHVVTFSKNPSIASLT